MKYLASLFPHSHIRNIKLYYILSFLSEFYFIVGNWIFFWLRYMKYGELGLLDSFAFLFGFIMEVPTGAIADSIGRKKTIAAAFFSSSLGFFLIATSTAKPQLIIGFLIAQIGWAFYSGAGEALAYDTLKEHKIEKEFDKVISMYHVLGLSALVTGGVLGGFFYDLNFRLPHILTACALGTGFIVALFLHEPRVDSEKFTLKVYLNNITMGFKQLLLPSIKPFLSLILITVGIGFMFGAGIIQPALAQHFGYDGLSLSILSATSLALGALSIRYIPWLRTHLTDEQGLQLQALGFIICFVLVTLPLGFIGGGLVLVVMGIGRAFSNPWTSVVVNRELPSEYRATALSAIEMIKKIPYILVAGVTGALIDASLLNQFCIGVAIVIAIVMALQWKLVKR